MLQVIMAIARNIISERGVTALLLLMLAVPYMMTIVSVRVEATRPGITALDSDAKVDHVRKALARPDYICADECMQMLEGQQEFVPDSTSSPKSPPMQLPPAILINHFH
ncbi:hypothetical protein GOP47_0016546 [Adiantum capillus-veneris]|uniref:Uncharacterized protein n=1 Tax=Adiantum capillus-veneris TaxID=13818 RepID=A0A9D4ZD32_ADICA|nr:hypothetical protein GOP47_0016546 [Adiantum capillus-veneris]